MKNFNLSLFLIGTSEILLGISRIIDKNLYIGYSFLSVGICFWIISLFPASRMLVAWTGYRIAWLAYDLGITEKPKRKKKKRTEYQNANEPGFIQHLFLGIAATILAVMFVVGLITFTQELLFTGDSHPVAPDVIPTPLPSQIPKPTVEVWWNSHPWFSQAQARELRTQANVINLAFVKGNNSAWYSPKTLEFDETWETGFANPIGFQSIQVNDGLVSVKIDYAVFNLNIYQPWFLQRSPEYAYLIDQNSELWRKTLSPEILVDVSTALNHLPFELRPNPNLSLSY